MFGANVSVAGVRLAVGVKRFATDRHFAILQHYANERTRRRLYTESRDTQNVVLREHIKFV